MTSVLLLHGALGSSTQLQPLQKSLEQSGHRVHLLNFSGHSGAPFQKSFGIETFSNDVREFLAEKKLERVAVFGYSMGGYVALWLARQHPLLISGIVTLGTKFDWSVESAERETKKMNAEKIIEKIPAFARILETRHRPNDWKELLKRTSDMMNDLGANPLLTPSVLKTIKCKTLILLGDQDDMADLSYSKDVAGFLPNGKFELLDHTPHPIEKVDIDSLTAILNKFLN